MRNSNKFFLQFNSTIVDDTKEQTTMERIIGFGNPYLFYYLSNAKSLYIDATFSIAPKPFYQCLVVMVFEETLQLYLPILYILMTNKSKKRYRNALKWIFKLSGRRANPATITCNFEQALLNAISGTVPYSKIAGFFFHWKQAIHRKLISLKFANEKEIVSRSMVKNSMDILTVILVNEITTKGFVFVNDNLKEAIFGEKDSEKLKKFWKYFENYWMSSNKMIETWNISKYQCNKNVVRRTNNGLESYNLRLKKLFKSGTPSFAQFVKTMRIESEGQQKIAQDYMNQAAKHTRIEENDKNFIYEPPPSNLKLDYDRTMIQ